MQNILVIHFQFLKFELTFITLANSFVWSKCCKLNFLKPYETFMTKFLDTQRNDYFFASLRPSGK